MILFVKTPARHTITFGHLEPDNTVAFVKLLIYDIESKHAASERADQSRLRSKLPLPLLPADMLLIYRGTTPLRDGQTLRGAGIPERTTLLVLPKVAGAPRQALLPPLPASRGRRR